jgi:hypothetical protein
MSPLPEYLQKLRERAGVMEKKMAGSTQSFVKTWSLRGKNAIVQKGGAVVMRFGPRWDAYLNQGGKLVANPQEGALFFDAFEHWWQGDANEWHREWCPRTFVEDAECPLCDSAQELLASSNKDEKDMGKQLASQRVLLLNAVMRNESGATVLGEDKLVDLRYISLSGQLYIDFSVITTGGPAGDAFARGNIGDPKTGYDVVLARPQDGGRWKMTCATNSSPIFSARDSKEAWANWFQRLINLPEMVQKELKTPDELFKAYAGMARLVQGATPPAVLSKDVWGPDMGAEPETDDESAGSEGGASDAGDLLGLDDLPDAGPAPEAPVRPTPAPRGRPRRA